MSNQPKAPDTRARAEQEKERLQRKGAEVKSTLTPLKIYLLAYNILSAIAWSYLLYLTLSHLMRHLPPVPVTSAWYAKLMGKGNSVPAPLLRAVERLRGGYHHKHLGWWTKVIQSVAVLEVAHTALGWVKSGLVSTGIQVASRLYTVWGVVEACPETHNHPLFITMLLAWSITEVVRYSFYATSILGVDVPPLTWLRYSLFYILYPLGASSEAFISFSTLPPFSTLPFFPHGIFSLKPISDLILTLPQRVRAWIVSTDFGTTLMWSLAASSLKSTTRAVVGRAWGWADYARFALFVVWWPGLWQLMALVAKQRRRVLGQGKVVGRANKAN